MTDGERVYAYFGNVGLFAFDMNGTPLCKNSLNEMTLATPAVARGSIIVRTASKLYRIGRQ